MVGPFSFTNCSIMPRKERLKEEKERELQQAAHGSGSLLSWMKASTSSKEEDEDERPESCHLVRAF
jgi:hypothetical protein